MADLRGDLAGLGILSGETERDRDGLICRGTAWSEDFQLGATNHE